jgi:type IV secretion system protein VirD4
LSKEVFVLGAILVFCILWFLLRPELLEKRGSSSSRKPSLGFRFGGSGSSSARWAGTRDIHALAVNDDAKGSKGRILVGSWRARPIAALFEQSLLVVGPTRSGKTTQVAVPNICHWDGPVLAASVKADLFYQTLGARKTKGPVITTGSLSVSGGVPCTWSPMRASSNWDKAVACAELMTTCARPASSSGDSDFWFSLARKLLAPLLLAASLLGEELSSVASWIDEASPERALEILTEAGAWEALQWARASWSRDGRQLGSVLATAESVLAPFCDPSLASPSSRLTGELEPSSLLSQKGTLYVLMRPGSQRRLAPYVMALVRTVLNEAFSISQTNAAPLDPPLLVVLDEAAQLAPLPDLDEVAATAAGHGVLLLTIFQDLSQIRARWGDKWPTILNNHQAKLFLGGATDPLTLEVASSMAGTEEVTSWSTTFDKSKGKAMTSSFVQRPLLTPEALRGASLGQAVGFFGHLPPVWVRLSMASFRPSGIRASRLLTLKRCLKRSS